MFVRELFILLIVLQCLSSLYAFENDSYESNSSSSSSSNAVVEDGQQYSNQEEPDKRETVPLESSNKSSAMRKELMDKIRKLISSPNRAFKSPFRAAAPIVVAPSKQVNTSRDQTGVTSRIRYYMNRLGAAKQQQKRFFDSSLDSASFEENSAEDWLGKRSTLKMTKKTQPKSPSWLKDFLTIRY